MDIQIVKHKENNIQIIIKCRQIDNEVIRLKSHIELFDSKLSAKKENELYFINSSDVLYFESVDNRTFLYTTDDVMEINQRLYDRKHSLKNADGVCHDFRCTFTSLWMAVSIKNILCTFRFSTNFSFIYWL